MDETLNRLHRLVYLLKKNPDGLRLRELSTELGASMARVRTDLEILTHELPVTSWFDDNGGHNRGGRGSGTGLHAMEVLVCYGLDRQDSPEPTNRCYRPPGKGRRRWIPVKTGADQWRELYDSPETNGWYRSRGSPNAALLDYIDAAGEAPFEMGHGLVYYWVWGFWYLVGRIKQN